MHTRYVNPFTDFGFKRLFGDELNKDLLTDFLNELLREQEGEIIDLEYLQTEQLGNTPVDRRAIFDLYCTNAKGEKFIVELQKTKQKFFKDRALYYSTFPIQEQAERGDTWDFELKAVYMIAILDFVFDADQDNPNHRYDVKLVDLGTQRVFYDKLMFIYLSMPKFNKTLEALESKFDKWLYAIKHLTELQDIPKALEERIFLKLFRKAEIAQFSPKEHKSYENSLKYYWDLNNSLDTAKEEGMQAGIAQGHAAGLQEGMAKGMEKGMEKERMTIAKAMKAKGHDTQTIAELTGLDRALIDLL